MQERDLKKIGEPTPEKAVSLTDRLKNTYFSKIHFDKAVSMLRAPIYDSLDVDTAINIARIMADSQIPPLEILEILQDRARAGRKDSYIGRYHVYDGEKAHQQGIAELNALLGKYEDAKRTAPGSRDSTDVYLFIAEVQVDRHENPTDTLRKTEQMIESDDTRTTHKSFSSQASDYAQMGSLYAKAGLIEEARRVFSLAEGIIDHSREGYNEVYALEKSKGKNDHEAKTIALESADIVSHDGSYDTLARIYVGVGWFEDALRVAEKLKEDKSHYFLFSIPDIVSIQLERGLVDDAVKTSKKLGGPIYLKALAGKMLHEAKTGKNYKETQEELNLRLKKGGDDEEYSNKLVEQAQSAIAGGNMFAAAAHLRSAQEPLSSVDYINIQIAFAQTLVHSGDLEGGKLLFGKIREAIDVVADSKNEDRWVIPFMLLDFAKGMDDAGLNSESVFKDLFKVLKGVPGIYLGPLTEETYGMWDKVIRELLSRKYLSLAREGLSEYQVKGSNGRIDGILVLDKREETLAYLAAAEIRQGILQGEMKNISLEQVQEILAGDDEEAKQAVRYFGLDKKLSPAS